MRDLFERYYWPVSYYFNRLGFSQEDSRDLAQETFVRAYRGLASFRHEAGFKTWLFTIAKNVGLNKMRAQRTEKRKGRMVDLDNLSTESMPRSAEIEEEGQEEKEGSVLPDTGPDPLEGLLSEERRKLLRQAFDDLPDRMRHTVFLRIYQDMTYREIAEVLKVSIQTVKSQLHQARQRLTSFLGAQFPDLELPLEDPPLDQSSPLKS